MEQLHGRATRRAVLMAFGGGAAALAFGAAPAGATPEAVAAEIKKRFGDKTFTEGKITLDLPTIAENGQVVPLGFEVESPMTATDYVKTVTFYAPGNPNPEVATFHFTPMMPKAAASLRIRMAGTQTISAYAEMSNGQVYTAHREVKVTIGGCGG